MGDLLAILGGQPLGGHRALARTRPRQLCGSRPGGVRSYSPHGAGRAERAVGDAAGRPRAAVGLYWLPLGAGGHFVDSSSRVYEALVARLERRPASDLYHSALQVEVAEGTFVIEQAPVHDWSGKQRGVVAEGAVDSRWAGRFPDLPLRDRLWPGGHIQMWQRQLTVLGD